MKKVVLLVLFFYCVYAPLFSEKNLEITHSNLKLVLYPDNMSFSLYQLSDIGKGRYTALFEDRNASATSWFSVQVGSKVFKLTRRHGKAGLLEKTPEGARFIFDLTDDFQAIQSFSFVESKNFAGHSLLKIDTSIENTSGKINNFALKSFIDTILGETQGVHFSSDIQKRFSAETCIFPQESIDSILVSQNKEASLMMLMKGFGVTVPSAVYMANWDRMNTLSWTHEFLAGRSFNSLYAINDSAVVIQWPSTELSPGDSVIYTALLGSYSDSWISSEEKDVLGAQVVPLNNQKTKQQVIIEKLLERIAEIEMNPEATSEAELVQLNNALDVLLNQSIQ